MVAKQQTLGFYTKGHGNEHAKTELRHFTLEEKNRNVERVEVVGHRGRSGMHF